MEVPWDSHKGLVTEDSTIMRWHRHLNEAGRLVGRRFSVTAQLQEELARAGFEEVKREVYKVS